MNSVSLLISKEPFFKIREPESVSVRNSNRTKFVAILVIPFFLQQPKPIIAIFPFNKL